MAYRSPSTPRTLLQVQIVDTSISRARHLLEGWGDILEIKQVQRQISRFSYSKPRTRVLSRIFGLIIFITCLIWLGLSKENGKIKLPERLELDGLQFIPANHPFIRYVGRWTSMPDGTRMDGSFPGVYLDVAMNDTRTLLISLHNSDRNNNLATSSPSPLSLTFLPSTNVSCAEPISLLARVDDDEYIILPNVTSTVTIRKKDLGSHSRHEARIIAPIVSSGVIETFQFEGVWIDKGGQLLPFEEVPPQVNEIGSVQGNRPRKMLEIITDHLGSLAGRNIKVKEDSLGSTQSILGGVMGWEYLLGEMFGIDHVTIGMDGMCLIQDCIGGRGNPVGLADVFFQSGPVGSDQYKHPWLFDAYMPEVMVRFIQVIPNYQTDFVKVMNIGNSDWESFQMYEEEYNKTSWELSTIFEDTYVSLIKAIRALAYPESLTSVDSFPYNYSPRSMPTGLPIFIMRPFRGQLEQATRSVVDRLRAEGDKSVFWLDTSGWLNTDVDLEVSAESQDFFLDKESPSKQWRLTERGNQRVAVLLHMHVCRYLAQDVEKCAFLPPEVYQGQAIDPEATNFDDFLHDEREPKLKELFWV